MQQAIASSRVLAQPQQAGARASRRQQQLVAFSGFRRAGAVDGLGSSGNATLQAAVQRQVSAAARCSGVKVMRVTRMMFERFTEKAIKVVMLAQEEARRLGHNFVGTEQILLGLIGESTGIAAKVLKSMGVTLKDARVEVEKIIGRGSGFVAVEIPFTPRAKRVLELSLEEARALGHNYIGTEHILLGLLREGEGVASRVLETLGADPQKIRTQVIRMVGESQEPVGSAVGGGSSGSNKMPTLEEYGTNLTQQAEEGKLDPVVGRKKEIERVTQVGVCVVMLHPLWVLDELNHLFLCRRRVWHGCWRLQRVLMFFPTTSTVLLRRFWVAAQRTTPASLASLVWARRRWPRALPRKLPRAMFLRRSRANRWSPWTWACWWQAQSTVASLRSG
jgi:ATP-dependent Clp protease ATP-binding subunit ClpC